MNKHTYLYIRPHPEGTNFENQITYIPAEMALLPKTKIGMPVGWQTKRGRGKVSYQSLNEFIYLFLERYYIVNISIYHNIHNY